MIDEREKDLRRHHARELKEGLLGRWYGMVLEVAEERFGRERAAELIRPHMEHSAMAGYLVIKQRLGITDDSMRGVARCMGAGHLMLKRDVGALKARDGEAAYVEFKECPFSCSTALACMTTCYHTVRGFAKAVGPQYEGDLFLSVRNGDSCCRKGIRLIGSDQRDSADRWIDVDLAMPEMSQEERDFFFQSYLGEFIVDTIRAMTDVLGQEGTRSLFTRSFDEAGRATALNLMGENWEEGTNPTELIKLVGEAFFQELTISKGQNAVEGLVMSCPFSGAPAPMCELIESFYNGMCQAVDPRLEFRYDRMMTRGDAECRWHMAIKDYMSSVTDWETIDEDLQRLTRRYARGDITKAEYEEMKRILRGE